MKEMFSFCVTLEDVPLYDTEKVTNISNMFEANRELKKIPHFKTSNIKSMERTFEGCVMLEEVPAIDTTKVINMNWVFKGCSSLKKIPNITFSDETHMFQAFKGCSLLDVDPGEIIKIYETKPGNLFTKFRESDIEDWFKDNATMKEKYPEYFI
jgi:hypothetical protein